ncbi:Flags: Precursor [Cyanidiococcus yangmingshanensis]|uniref:Flags n=1 Tax=Cyanidiococcus yangmingshanensis TaxID=2690220 RepID=A0A7J7IHP5_9RHOD|nr:Flags: Precursor [Cyanidiococcus yangmingshanensis]
MACVKVSPVDPIDYRSADHFTLNIMNQLRDVTERPLIARESSLSCCFLDADALTRGAHGAPRLLSALHRPFHGGLSDNRHLKSESLGGNVARGSFLVSGTGTAFVNGVRVGRWRQGRQRGACPRLGHRPATPRLARVRTKGPVHGVRMQFVDPQQSVSAVQDGWQALTLALASASLLLVDAAGDGSSAAAVATSAAAAQKDGLWNGFVHLIEAVITGVGDSLASLGVPGAYGFAIILLTVIVKTITFPLNYKQMKSTMAMQALAPKVRALQARYRDNPQLLNVETARLYQEAKVNPLTGCLPVFIQLPVWIALYRALLNLAADNRLDQGFFWLPSLEGPVRQGQGLSTWLFPFQNGAPPIGWHDAIAYLLLPCMLVISQMISQKLLQPPVQDPQQQQANAILRFLPFMVGWFSLNVPSGLGLYWVTNNIVSTLQTIAIKRYLASNQPQLTATGNGDVGGSGASRSPATSSDGRLDTDAIGFGPRSGDDNGDAGEPEDLTKPKRKTTKKKRR